MLRPSVDILPSSSLGSSRRTCASYEVEERGVVDDILGVGVFVVATIAESHWQQMGVRLEFKEADVPAFYDGQLRRLVDTLSAVVLYQSTEAAHPYLVPQTRHIMCLDVRERPWHQLPVDPTYLPICCTMLQKGPTRPGAACGDILPKRIAVKSSPYISRGKLCPGLGTGLRSRALAVLPGHPALLGLSLIHI